MQTLTIRRESGNIAKAPEGRDHVSGLLFLTPSEDDIPEEFRQGRFAPCSSAAAAEALGLDADDQWGLHVREAMRLNPGLTLWVGFAPRSDDFMAVEELQRAAGGEIRQMGVLDQGAEVTKAAVAALQARADALDEAWMPLSIILAPKVADIARLPADLAASAPAVSVLIGRDAAARAPAIGTLVGVLSARAVSESIAWVERCETGLSAPAFSDGTPYGRADRARLEALDKGRYIWLRTYPGIAGVYFSDSHTLDAPGGDYDAIELRRTMDKAVRGTRAALLPELGRPAYFNADGTLRADTLRHLRSVAQRAVEQMERDGEVSAWEVDIDPAQDVLGTSRVEFTVHAVPVGVMRKAVVSIGFVKQTSE